MQLHLDPVSAIVLVGILLTTTLLVLISVRNRTDHYSLMIFLGVVAIIQTESILNRTGLSTRLPLFINISIPLVFLAGPLLFQYTRALVSNTTTMSRAHFLPFLFYFAYSFFFFLQPGDFKISVMMRTFHPLANIQSLKPSFDVDPLDIQGWIVVELMSLHLFSYALASIVVGLKSIRDRSKLRWIVFLNGVMVMGSAILFLSQGGIVNGYVFLKTPFPHFIPDLWITAAMYLIVFYLLFNPVILKSTGRYNKSSLPVDLRKIHYEKIRRLMESEHLYRSPDFSVDLLATKSGISKHHISQILNEELKVTFYEFVHQYRIEDAKRMLRSNDPIKIEQLAYDLGYKSKGTFFTAFKKATDLTPAQYKQQAVHGL